MYETQEAPLTQITAWSSVPVVILLTATQEARRAENAGPKKVGPKNAEIGTMLFLSFVFWFLQFDSMQA